MVTILENNTYKLLQINSLFINKYGYNQVLINQYSSYSKTESWLFNPNNKDYQLIRVTFNNPSTISYDYERIEDHINYFSKSIKELKFLDIHIGNDKYDKDDETYDHCIVEDNYYDGVDLHNIYPEIYNVIHTVDDTKKEISSLVTTMRKTIDNRKRQYIKDTRPIFTYIIMGICTIVYLLSVFLSLKYNETTVYILLGADYMTFTLGLRQFYRLITCAFVHGGVGHFLSNMYSLYVLGSYFERQYGRSKYIITLFTCILVGSLTQGIINENTVTLGISGGLYGLMAIFLLDLIVKRRVPISNFLPMIFINISINFMSTTAWLAHLGGMLTGYIFYKIYEQNDNKAMILLLSIMVGFLLYKYFSITKIEPLYAGTDMEYLKILSDLGLDKYAQSLADRLIKVYTSYGG